MKHLLKMSDLTREELFHILDVADELKADRKAGRAHPLLAGKSLALIFAKPSTRTRASFQVGMYQLGGLAHYLNAVTEMQLGYGEAIEVPLCGEVRPCGTGRSSGERGGDGRGPGSG